VVRCTLGIPATLSTLLLLLRLLPGHLSIPSDTMAPAHVKTKPSTGRSFFRVNRPRGQSFHFNFFDSTLLSVNGAAGRNAN